MQDGAKVLIAPTVRVVPLSEDAYGNLDELLQSLRHDTSQEHWVALPSRSCVEFLLWRCEKLSLAPEHFTGLKVAVLCEDAKAMAAHGVEVAVSARDTIEMGTELQKSGLGQVFVLGACNQPALRDTVHWAHDVVPVDAYSETRQLSSYEVGLPELRKP